MKVKQAASMSDDADAYNFFASSSVDVTSAYTVPSQNNNIITLVRSVRDVDCNKRRKFLYTVPLNKDGNIVAGINIPPVEIPAKELLRLSSPSGRKLALLVNEDRVDHVDGGNGSGSSSSSSSARQVLEIWSEHGTKLERRCVLPKDLHGNVCTDTSWFGGMCWSPTEEALVYVAEKSTPKTKSFFGRSDDCAADDVRVQEGGQYTLGVGRREDWGEKYASTSLLRLFCISIKSGKVAEVENCPGENSVLSTDGSFTMGQPIFSPCGSHIIYTAWDAGGGGRMPKRLGSIYCSQRPSSIYCSSVDNLLKQLSNNHSAPDENLEKDTEFSCLTPNLRLASSPRFSVSNKNIASLTFLGSVNGFDTHAGNVGLFKLDWDVIAKKFGSFKELVPERDGPDHIDDFSPDEEFSGLGFSFPGLFLTMLPKNCFTNDGKFIFLSSLWGSVNRVLRISVEDGSICPVYFDLCSSDAENSASKLQYCSQSVLDVSRGGVIVSQSEPNNPALVGRLKICEGSADELNENIMHGATLLSKMSPISTTSHSYICESRGTLTWKLMQLKPNDGTDSVIQAILLLPNRSDNENPPALIVVPHGGPHSCLSTMYIPSYAFLCAHGNYAVLEVNYRGSTGFGQKSLESLAGHVGTQDVRDVVQVTKAVIEQKLVDGDRVGVCGGSHGGFLAGHLIGQHSELFKVAAMRNPVTNIPSMVTATDIPDWCYVETFGSGKYDWTDFRPTKRDEIASMYDASPVAHLNNVSAPTLVAIGLADKRVPASQGIEYFHALRSKGLKTKLLVYEKCDHAIDLPTCEADHWINIKKWFDEHL
eukprot:CAMPEP_0196815540 /NCGR_PEP_ID=MMETSP1362-20130617/50418_1 /TAXON_ID=163516 /ORGANISM="Leptocylindrus danicus, Strain CCMP1856" /LENGTH=816 /DNA_ID=CAMNT_0042192531 /DNA_START=72 /DNA_END=2522 /DNA_ORIENTATION=-